MYELDPYSASPHTSKVKIYAEALREGGQLSVNFIVEDKSRVIVSDADSYTNQRKNELWKNTCYEVFFGQKGSPAYWELNLSPGGNWNLYTFQSNRHPQPPKEEAKVTEIGFEKSFEEEHLMRLEIKIPIQSLNLKGPIEVSLTAVLEFKSKEKAYYAIKHVSDKPDFHQRDSFVCNLD